MVTLLALGFATLAAGQDAGNRAAPSPTPSSSAKTNSVDPALKARVDAWWKARALRDHKNMYDLFDAEYRAACSYEVFVAQNVIRTRFEITHHDVLSAAREEGRAKVTLSYVAKTGQFGDQTMGLEETWVKDASGEWWKYWEPVATPFPTPTPAPGAQRNLPCKTP